MRPPRPPARLPALHRVPPHHLHPLHLLRRRRALPAARLGLWLRQGGWVDPPICPPRMCRAGGEAGRERCREGAGPTRAGRGLSGTGLATTRHARGDAQQERTPRLAPPPLQAHREKLWAIMLYSLASMLLTAEVGAASGQRHWRGRGGRGGEGSGLGSDQHTGWAPCQLSVHTRASSAPLPLSSPAHCTDPALFALSLVLLGTAVRARLLHVPHRLQDDGARRRVAVPPHAGQAQRRPPGRGPRHRHRGWTGQRAWSRSVCVGGHCAARLCCPVCCVRGGRPSRAGGSCGSSAHTARLACRPPPVTLSCLPCAAVV